MRPPGPSSCSVILQHCSMINGWRLLVRATELHLHTRRGKVYLLCCQETPVAPLAAIFIKLPFVGQMDTPRPGTDKESNTSSILSRCCETYLKVTIKCGRKLQLRMRKSEPRFTSELMTGSSRADTREFKARAGTGIKTIWDRNKTFRVQSQLPRICWRSLLNNLLVVKKITVQTVPDRLTMQWNKQGDGQLGPALRCWHWI